MNFRNYQPEQRLLLPPSMQDWVPEGHLALFVSDLVDTLDLGEIYRRYDGSKGGQPAYHPLMMVKLLLYGYCEGIFSSRQIEKATWEHIAFRLLSADQHPDHDTIANFRKLHLKALSGLFVQVLKIAQKAGLVKLGHVSVDGTKINANAARLKTLSEEQMTKQEKRLKKQIDDLKQQAEALLEAAEKVDADEDQKYGKGKRGDELPKELVKRETRLKKIIECKEALEAESKDPDKQPQECTITTKEEESGSQTTQKTVVRNTTDPDSRIMRSSGGNWSQSYNAQAVVDSQAQIIVASAVVNACNDRGQLLPMLAKTMNNAGALPECTSADCGYFRVKDISHKLLRRMNVLVPPQLKQFAKSFRGKHAFPISNTMRERLEVPENKELYRKRKTIVEPVFGQIKSARGFRQFSFRGIDPVSMEWDLICLTHNMLKLYRYGISFS
jgi:transposase